MPSIPNDTVWNNEDVDDGFLDEDEIEIVSLLDHPDASGSTAAVGQSNNDTNGSNINQGKTTAPRMHPVGLCVIIVLFLLVASMLLSQPSSLSPEIKTPSVITIGENTDASDIVNNDKNNDDEEQPLPSPSSLSSSLEIETKNTSSASTSIKNKNENGSHQPPSSSSNDISNVTQTTTSAPPPPKTGKYDGESEEDAIKWFELHTGNSRIDQAYRLAMDELHQNIEHDARDHAYFMTGGTKGGGNRSWTRQTAYAIELGAGIVHPDVSRQSLEACTEVASIFARDKQYSATVWYQDEPIGSEAGGWPKLADAIVGARGAWNLYLYTGNSTMLEWAYELTLRSLLRAESEVLQNDNGKFFANHLFGGGSFFMASNAGSTTKYWCDYGELNHTKVLSTNVLYYNAYHYAYRMGTILMENNQIVKSLKERSKALKKTIRERLWIEEKGLYAYFEDPDGNLGEYTEGLGVALALLSDDFESDHRIKLLFEKVHRTELGIPSMWPRNDRIESYDPSYDDDNGRIWPCEYCSHNNNNNNKYSKNMQWGDPQRLCHLLFSCCKCSCRKIDSLLTTNPFLKLFFYSFVLLGVGPGNLYSP